uniref:Serine/threonine-protein phosphatase n=1 Tax=Plectus sambesii TaxID=2011161 RepID=A0A914XLS7_9BILA
MKEMTSEKNEAAKALAERVIGKLESDKLIDGLSEHDLQLLCEYSINVLAQESAMISTSAPINIFGDMHGQFDHLLKWLDIVGRPPASRWLFLGDYVDRGIRGLEVICLLLSYKILFPADVFLLRGNHECARLNRTYGFYDECRRRFSERVWKLFQGVFNELPLVAVVAGRIICMHGGLSPDIKDWRSLQLLSKPRTAAECDAGIAMDLMWSDPTTDPCVVGFEANQERNASYVFSEEAVRDFCDKMKLDLIVRAHEVVQEGHFIQANNRLCTVFSAPNYCGTSGNRGSVMRVNGQLRVSFDTLRPKPGAGLSDVDRADLLRQQLDAAAEPKSPKPGGRRSTG